MKTLKYFFFIAFGGLLMAADCSNKDSEFYNDVYLSVPNLITIENQDHYTVNDILWINSDNFSRYLSEPNQSTPLDVYKTTGGAQSFEFSYVLEKQVSADTWELVPLGSNLIVERGTATETESYIAAVCKFSATTNRYELRNGLKFTQPGNYRLSFGYNSTAANAELRSESVSNNLFVNINSVTTSLDASGNYNFTVSP